MACLSSNENDRLPVNLHARYGNGLPGEEQPPGNAGFITICRSTRMHHHAKIAAVSPYNAPRMAVKMVRVLRGGMVEQVSGCNENE